jgi:hypothetical protein
MLLIEWLKDVPFPSSLLELQSPIPTTILKKKKKKLQVAKKGEGTYLSFRWHKKQLNFQF